MTSFRLPDIIASDLKVIFCDAVVDRESLMMQHYYASPRDKFWRILQEVAFTDKQLTTSPDPVVRDANYQYLKSKKIGLINLTKSDDKELEPGEIARLINLIKEHKPKVMAFNGKNIAELYFNRKVELGEQKEKIGKTRIFVLASTANSASSLWNKRQWREVSNIIKK